MRKKQTKQQPSGAFLMKTCQVFSSLAAFSLIIEHRWLLLLSSSQLTSRLLTTRLVNKDRLGEEKKRSCGCDCEAEMRVKLSHTVAGESLHRSIGQRERRRRSVAIKSHSRVHFVHWLEENPKLSIRFHSLRSRMSLTVA
jgi:hypothetical protein